ncbi:amidase [Brevibacterium litoralis]|uniref:amidase n=1 Tax=Brevibacterium litoralis TaxID=3138935 RepID=UPI003D9A5E55
MSLPLVESTAVELFAALAEGRLTSVELVARSLARIDAYDTNGPRLGAVIEEFTGALVAARASDDRRARGETRGPWDGIPFTVKDSYAVAGMSLAAGSPAFVNLRASKNAFSVEALIQAGAVLLGRTNMPPMAAGGMQDGVYGRAESPYSADHLTAAWYSGSSNGSGTATGASYAPLGMGEETVSSGRSPASNNGLVAYTPSRGLVSIRGNWPLFPVRDVVVPHTRTVQDMLAVLDVLVATDPDTECDLWRDQTSVPLPVPQDVRPETHTSLADSDALRGVRLGVPTMYTGADPRIEVRDSVRELWDRAVRDLEAAGARIVELPEFPVMDRDPGHGGIADNNAGVTGRDADGDLEFVHVNAHAAQKFLDWVGDPAVPCWDHVDPSLIFPNPAGGAAERLGVGYAAPLTDYAATLKASGGVVDTWEEIEGFASFLLRLETRRKRDFEDWMDSVGVDGVVFPANADVAEATTAEDVEAFRRANRNGTYFSNMNREMRELGIPSVSVSMGVMDDTGMPVSLTVVGKAYTDPTLLAWAYAYEHVSQRREAPGRTPELPAPWEPAEVSTVPSAVAGGRPTVRFSLQVRGDVCLVLGATDGPCALGDLETAVLVNGRPVPVDTRESGRGTWRVEIPLAQYLADPVRPEDPRASHLDDLSADEIVVIALARTPKGAVEAHRDRVVLRPRKYLDRAVGWGA